MTGLPLTLPELAGIEVARLKGVGERKLESLHAVGVETVLDLLTTYPRRWVDRTNEARVADLEPGREALVIVTVGSVAKRMMRNRRTMVTATVGDDSGRLSIVFFNQPWRERQLRAGLQIALFGKADVYRGGLQMTNPIVDLIGDRTGRIVPIYPQSEKAALTTWEIAGWVEDALSKCRAARDRRPAAGRGASRGWSCSGGTRRSRPSTCPRRSADKEQARRRLAFDELLRVQTVLVLRKRALEREARGIRHVVDGSLTGRLRAALPFDADRRAAAGDRRDRGRPRRAAPDAPPAAGRRRRRQDARRGRARCSPRCRAGTRAR